MKESDKLLLEEIEKIKKTELYERISSEKSNIKEQMINLDMSIESQRFLYAELKGLLQGLSFLEDMEEHVNDLLKFAKKRK